jgi:hypothetical protein
LAAISYLGYHGNGRHFDFFSTPQKLPHTTVDIPTKWIIIWLPNHGYISPKSEDFCIWWPFWIQNGHHSKPTMDINSQHHNLLGNQISPKSKDFCILVTILDSQNGRHSKPTMTINLQHHNLLGNQISPKSEDFCIWRPFCTLVTMATATILNFFQPPKSCYTLRWIFLQSFMKFDERNPNFF